MMEGLDPLGATILTIGLAVTGIVCWWDDRRVQRRHDAWLESLHKH